MDDLTRAFLMGFAVSREGFNGECAFDHLAPDDLTEATDYRWSGHRPGAGISALAKGLDEAVLRLAREAIAFILANPD